MFQDKIDNLKKYSPVLLRSAIGIVFLWFGFSQLKNPAQWVRMVPEYVPKFGLETTSIIYMHGIFEVIFATLLILGLYTRLVSLILALSLIHITFIVGYGPTGARDLAIALATLSIFFHGSDDFCLDKLIFKKNN